MSNSKLTDNLQRATEHHYEAKQQRADRERNRRAYKKEIAMTVAIGWKRGNVPFPNGEPADGYVCGPWGIRPYGKPRRWAVIHQPSHKCAADTRTLLGAKTTVNMLNSHPIDWTLIDPLGPADPVTVRACVVISHKAENL